MNSLPYLRLFAWIGIAIAISFASFHLLAPDYSQLVESEVRSESAKPLDR